MLYGVHIGEHGFDVDNIIEEIRERVIKPGYNFVTIRTRARKGEFLDLATYETWAKFLAENKIYFIFLYTMMQKDGQLISSLDKTIVARMKEIAGEYYLGDMLGELGSSFGAKQKGYKSPTVTNPAERAPFSYPRQDLSDMESAAKNFINIVNKYVQIDKKLGVPHISLVEPTALSKYAVMAGVDYPMLELMVASPDILVSYIRGVARAFGLPWGTYMAHEWYGGVRHSDTLKRKRLSLGMKYAYLSGSQVFCIESGDELVTAYGERHEVDSDVCQDYRNSLDELKRIADSDSRDPEGPRVKLAFVSGRYDAYCGWGGSSVWGQYDREEWGHGEAEHSWRLLHELGTKRQWWDIENYGDEDLSGSAGLGLYDIVPIEADVDALSRYDYLIFLGWNTMTDEDMDKLTEYVRSGGHLLMSLSHLNYSPSRDKNDFIAPPADKLRELFGIELTGETVRANVGLKFTDSISPDIKYPRVPLDVSDPILSSGFLNFAGVRLDGAHTLAVLSDSFRDHGDSTVPAVIENKLGEGTATLVTARSYPGDPALTPLYRVLVRELVTASARTADIKVISSDKLRYSVYEDGKIYLLNTDYDLPITVIIRAKEKETQLTLAPLELKIITI